MIRSERFGAIGREAMDPFSLGSDRSVEGPVRWGKQLGDLNRRSCEGLIGAQVTLVQPAQWHSD